ncbi:MAG: hypothetical protein IPO91_25285 [Chloroflexi bacterium]|nr:hypothetical protein [Chloroflexota bacterium]
MADQIVPIRIFISSPGDLSEERRIIKSVIDDLNYSPHYQNKYKLIAYSYEGNIPPIAGEAPQIVVDRFLLQPDHADVLVCILWLRMGTPTEGLINPETGAPYLSGTEYEFMTAYRANQVHNRPLILLYQYKNPPESFDKFDQEQYQRVQKFFDRFRSGGDLKGFVTEIKERSELYHTLRSDVEKLLVYELSRLDSAVMMLSRDREPIYFLPDNLPSEYIARDHAIESLREALLGSHSVVGVVASTTLHGQGGLGKSVLARAICEDPAIRSFYKDGILWATLGQDSDVVRHQRDWIHVLGGDQSDAANIESGKVALRKLLKDRRFLLVLDDVWKRSDVQALNVVDSNSRILITTRDVSQTESAILVPLSEMQVEESRKLLELSSQGILRDTAILDQISERLGHLPLALNIVGSMLRRGVTWEDISDALDEGDLQFVSYGQRSILSAIASSVSHLTTEDRERYLELVVFPKDEPLEEDSVFQLWNKTGNKKPREVRRMLSDFRDQALLQNDNGLHDLHHDYLRSVVKAEKQRELHGIVADAYWQDNWANMAAATNVQYALRRLAYHLFNADRISGLEALLRDYSYLKAVIRHLGTSALIKQLNFLSEDPAIDRLLVTIKAGAYVLSGHPEQLINQVFGRLGDTSALSRISIDEKPFLRLLSPTLNSPYGNNLKQLMGHLGGLKDCAVSPDENYIISASIDSTLRVWNKDTGTTLLVLEGHQGTVNGCDVHPQGTMIASASVDGTIRLWDMLTGKLLYILEGHTDSVSRCAFSPDGQLLLSASSDHTLRLWNINTGFCVRTYRGHTDAVRDCAFASDTTSRMLFSASSDHTLKMWDRDSGAIVYTFTGHSGEVMSVDCSQVDTVIASSGTDGTVRVWDYVSRRETHKFQTHQSGVLTVKFTPDGQQVACGSWDRTLQIWNIEAGKSVYELKGHKGGINGCAISSDGKFIVSASWDSSLKLWDITSGKEIRTFEGHIGRVSSCRFSPNGQLAVSSYGDTTIKLWNVNTQEVVRTLEGHKDYVRSCRFSPDSRYLLSTSEDMQVILWDISTGNILKTFTGHTGPVRDCVFTPDGNRVITCSWDQTIRIWNIETGEVDLVLDGHNDRISGLSIDKDGQLLFSASDDKTIKIWELPSGNLRQTLVGHSDFVRSCSVDENGSVVISSAIDGTIHIWELQPTPRARHILKKHPLYVRDCKLSRSGKLAISVGDDGVMRLWDTLTGNEITCWYGDGALMSCDLHPDERLIMVGDGMGKVHFLAIEDN